MSETLEQLESMKHEASESDVTSQATTASPSKLVKDEGEVVLAIACRLRAEHRMSTNYVEFRGQRAEEHVLRNSLTEWTSTKRVFQWRQWTGRERKPIASLERRKNYT
jgi:hypothetical protein